MTLFLPLLIICGLTLPSAQAQEYQRAKDVLKAIVLKDTFLYQSPTTNSKKLIHLPKRTTVLVYGKLGDFMEIRYQNVRGWGQLQSISVQGPADLDESIQPKSEPTVTKPTSKPHNQQNPMELPLRVNPYTTIGLSGKSFYGQLRLGLIATHKITNTLSAGGLVELVLLKGSYLSLGPTLRHEWKTDSFFFNPAFDASFLYYRFDHNADKDQGFGFQWALGNDVLVYQTKSFEPSITLRTGVDMMFFMFDQVRIPYWVAVGAGFKF